MDESKGPAAHALATGQLTGIERWCFVDFISVPVENILMPEIKSSAMKRIQVGLVGLVVVLLFVSLANMALDRAIKDGTDANASPSGATASETPKKPDEPLAELGVAPGSNESKVPAGNQLPQTGGVPATN
jgi:hypothetical protein